MNEKQMQAAADAIRFRYGQLACPACGCRTLNMGATWAVKEFQEVPAPDAPVTPVVTVFCNNCGRIQLFNAIKLGIIDITTGKYTVE